MLLHSFLNHYLTFDESRPAKQVIVCIYMRSLQFQLLRVCVTTRLVFDSFSRYTSRLESSLEVYCTRCEIFGWCVSLTPCQQRDDLHEQAGSPYKPCIPSFFVWMVSNASMAAHDIHTCIRCNNIFLRICASMVL